ncbi:MAG TPA: AbrB/MazE/SpoVT family DNA-binding domain-containing protein [Thermoanaerobaculia bacterium]|nr:AbrB/MazE/SpoVT family DNA-binding domain-containing protein [Thermoanaerobaculia bacterium]
MPTATITSKGQITLPREVREHLHLSEGDQLEFQIDPGGEVRVRPLTGSAKDYLGLLHRPGMRPLSVREIDEAIGTYHAEENARILKGRLHEEEE